jgi:hypothetical protein
MSDVMKLFCLFFLMRNTLTGSAADLSNMLLAETVLVLFVQKIEDRTVDRGDSLYYLIVAGSLFVATIKLSSLLLCLVPAYLTLRVLMAHRGPHWIRLAILAAMVVLPWLVRFPILSGYLVYPLYQVDLFDVDWKVPRKTAMEQYFYVSEFAKTNADRSISVQLAKDQGLLQWVPVWFARENMVNRSMAIALCAVLVGLMAGGIWRLRKNLQQHPDLMGLGAVLILGTAVWFLKDPAFRFGWSWAIILLAFGLYAALRSVHLLKWLRWSTLALLFLSLSLATVRSVTESADILPSILLRPAPIPLYSTRDTHLGSLNVKIAPSHKCWGTLPPCFTVDHDPNLAARGGSIEDGFRIQKH